jgi:hypothetical protein
MLAALLATALTRAPVALSSLGFPDGIALHGGSVALRLPVHPGLRRLGFRFPVTAEGDLKGAYVRVLIAGKEVASLHEQAVRAGVLAGEAEIGDAARGSVDLVVESRFPDCDGPSGHAQIPAGGEVVFEQDAGAAREPLANYGGAFTVIEPRRPDLAWDDLALSAAYRLHVISGWRRTSVGLGTAAPPGAVPVTNLAALPTPQATSPPSVLSLSALGVGGLAQRGEDVRFDIPFTLGQLGGAPDRAQLGLLLSAGAAGRVDAILNGRPVNAFAISSGSQTLRVPLPSSSLRGTNLVRLDVRVANPAAFCKAQPPLTSIAPSSTLAFSGAADLPDTIERRIGELHGNVTVGYDPALFAQSFAVMNALGSVNRTIAHIDARPLANDSPAAIVIGAPPDIEPDDGGSYGEVRVEGERLLISYVGDPSVLERLPDVAGLLAGADGTHFEFGKTGPVLTRGGLPETRSKRRGRATLAIYAGFALILAVAVYLIAQRARRFS